MPDPPNEALILWADELSQGIVHDVGLPLEGIYARNGKTSHSILNSFEFTQDADGVIRTTADPWQLQGGYGQIIDDAFDIVAPNKHETFQWQIGSGSHAKSYEIEDWKGDYPFIGDGGETEFLSHPGPQRSDPYSTWWNADPTDPATPNMTESVSIAGAVVESSAPNKPQPWVNGWQPEARDMNLNDLQFSATITFRSTAMFKAFMNSASVQNQPGLVTPDAATHSARINF
jgi:hypothetical protein